MTNIICVLPPGLKPKSNQKRQETHEDGDTEESKKHRTTKTLIQLEKAKQKPVSFAVLTKCGFDAEKYTDNDAPLPSTSALSFAVSNRLQTVLEI